MTRRSWWIAGAAAAAVAVAGGTAIAVTMASRGNGGQHDPLPAHRPEVRVALPGGATGTVTRAAVTTPISLATVLQVGDAVTATKGPVELLDADGATLRLDTSAQVRWLSGKLTRPATATDSMSHPPASATAGGMDPSVAQFELVSGRVYVRVDGGHAVGLQTPSAHAQVKPGRLIAACTGTSCTFTALEEDQEIHPRVGEMITLDAHQTGTTTGNNFSLERTLPDVLRADPWITRNTGMDQAAHHTGTPISGASITGTWRITITDNPSLHQVIHRLLKLVVTCPSGRCAMTATQSPANLTCPHGTRCLMTSAVKATSHFIDGIVDLHFAYPVDCDGDGKKDGSASAADRLTISGNDAEHRADRLYGPQTIIYHPAKGSPCIDAPSRNIETTVRGTRGSMPAAAAAQIAQIDSLLVRHTLNDGACSSIAGVTRSYTRAIAGIVCRFSAAKLKDPGGLPRPNAFNLIQFGSLASLRAAYFKQTAGQPRHFGFCDTDVACEGTIIGSQGRISGRKVSTGTQLVAFQPEESLVLVVATSRGSFGAMDKWFRMTFDFSFYPARTDSF